MSEKEEFKLSGPTPVYVCIGNPSDDKTHPVEITSEVAQDILDIIDSKLDGITINTSVEAKFVSTYERHDIREDYFDEQVIQKAMNKVKGELGNQSWDLKKLREMAKSRLTRMN
jgi:hypothetical protein